MPQSRESQGWTSTSSSLQKPKTQSHQQRHGQHHGATTALPGHALSPPYPSSGCTEEKQIDSRMEWGRLNYNHLMGGRLERDFVAGSPSCPHCATAPLSPGSRRCSDTAKYPSWSAQRVKTSVLAPWGKCFPHFPAQPLTSSFCCRVIFGSKKLFSSPLPCTHPHLSASQSGTLSLLLTQAEKKQWLRQGRVKPLQAPEGSRRPSRLINPLSTQPPKEKLSKVTMEVPAPPPHEGP